MQIMHTKGLLIRDESERSHVYAPAQAQDSLQTNLLKDLMQKAFAGSAKALVLAALTSGISKKERAEIEKLLKEMTRNEPASWSSTRLDPAALPLARRADRLRHGARAGGAAQCASAGALRRRPAAPAGLPAVAGGRAGTCACTAATATARMRFADAMLPAARRRQPDGLLDLAASSAARDRRRAGPLCAAVLAVRMALGLLWIDAQRQATGAPRMDSCGQAVAHGRTFRRDAARCGCASSTSIASPLTAGWWRPVVLVPASLVDRHAAATCSKRCWRTNWRTSGATITWSTCCRT